MTLPRYLDGEVSQFYCYLTTGIEGPGDWSLSIDDLMNAIVTAKIEALTVWNVHVDGEMYDPHDNLVTD